MGFGFALKWEDHKVHQTTQDYGDMFGWDELTQKVAKAYYSLTPEQRKQTIIDADNYGEAGAIHHYGKLYNLPDVVCLDSSFALWAPENIDAKYIIYAGRDFTNGEKLITANCIGSYKKLGEIDNPLAREKGTIILLFEDIKPPIQERYRKELLKTRNE